MLPCPAYPAGIIKEVAITRLLSGHACSVELHAVYEDQDFFYLVSGSTGCRQEGQEAGLLLRCWLYLGLASAAVTKDTVQSTVAASGMTRLGKSRAISTAFQA